MTDSTPWQAPGGEPQAPQPQPFTPPTPPTPPAGYGPPASGPQYYAPQPAAGQPPGWRSGFGVSVNGISRA